MDFLPLVLMQAPASVGPPPPDQRVTAGGDTRVDASGNVRVTKP